jgi:HSP20 family protein
LRGLEGFIDFLSELADNGGHEQSGEIGDDKRGIKAVYGFTVRVGDGDRSTVGPHRRGRSADVSAEQVIEPVVDVFDEGRTIVVVAELPGIADGGARYDVAGDELRLSAKGKGRTYRTTVNLPCSVTGTGATSSFRNGVLELKLPKVGQASR